MKLLCYLWILVALSVQPVWAAHSGAHPPKAGQGQAQTEPVNLNTASLEELTRLTGIGPKKAEAILAWRDANGRFERVEQLLEVKGIGPKILEANRARLSL